MAPAQGGHAQNEKSTQFFFVPPRQPPRLWAGHILPNRRLSNLYESDLSPTSGFPRNGRGPTGDTPHQPRLVETGGPYLKPAWF